MKVCWLNNSFTLKQIMYKVREIPLFDYWSYYLSDFLYYFIKTFSQPKFKLMQILYLISYP